MRTAHMVLASLVGVGAPSFAAAKRGVTHRADKNGLQGKAEVEGKVNGPDYLVTAIKNGAVRCATIANYEEAEEPLFFNAA